MSRRGGVAEGGWSGGGGNRCAATEAPVPPLHKARIFGMSNEQVLCIIHLCSIFHAEEKQSGLLEITASGLLAPCDAPLRETLRERSSLWENVCVSAYNP